jgi:predicted flap endonuclease-1-like 5' DNA nuclease
MAEPEPASVVSTFSRESVTGIRIAVTMSRGDDAPSEEIELLADELIEITTTDPPLLGAEEPVRMRSGMPPLPPMAARSGAPRPPQAAALAQPAEPEQLQLEIDRLLRRQRARDAYLSELEKTCVQRSQELLEADKRAASLTSRVHQQALRIAELEQQLRDRSLLVDLQPAAASGMVDSDELLRIRGIGPNYARALRAIGVDSLAAIAAWSLSDVSAVAERLEIKTGRIQRDRWIEQARALLARDSAAAGSSR